MNRAARIIAQQLAKADGEWDESKHPRSDNGEFASKGSGSVRRGGRGKGEHPFTEKHGLPAKQKDYEAARAGNKTFRALTTGVIPEKRGEVVGPAAGAVTGVLVGAGLGLLAARSGKLPNTFIQRAFGYAGRKAFTVGGKAVGGLGAVATNLAGRVVTNPQARAALNRAGRASIRMAGEGAGYAGEKLGRLASHFPFDFAVHGVNRAMRLAGASKLSQAKVAAAIGGGIGGYYGDKAGSYAGGLYDTFFPRRVDLGQSNPEAARRAATYPARAVVGKTETGMELAKWTKGNFDESKVKRDDHGRFSGYGVIAAGAGATAAGIATAYLLGRHFGRKSIERHLTEKQAAGIAARVAKEKASHSTTRQLASKILSRTGEQIASGAKNAAAQFAELSLPRKVQLAAGVIAAAPVAYTVGKEIWNDLGQLVPHFEYGDNKQINVSWVDGQGKVRANINYDIARGKLNSEYFSTDKRVPLSQFASQNAKFIGPRRDAPLSSSGTQNRTLTSEEQAKVDNQNRIFKDFTEEAVFNAHISGKSLMDRADVDATLSDVHAQLKAGNLRYGQAQTLTQYLDFPHNHSIPRDAEVNYKNLNQRFNSRVYNGPDEIEADRLRAKVYPLTQYQRNSLNNVINTKSNEFVARRREKQAIGSVSANAVEAIHQEGAKLADTTPPPAQKSGILEHYGMTQAEWQALSAEDRNIKRKVYQAELEAQKLNDRLANKADASSTLRKWLESEISRHPKGTPVGGEFAPKNGSGVAAAAADSAGGLSSGRSTAGAVGSHFGSSVAYRGVQRIISDIPGKWGVAAKFLLPIAASTAGGSAGQTVAERLANVDPNDAPKEGDAENAGRTIGGIVGGIAGAAGAGLLSIPSGPGAFAAAVAGDTAGGVAGEKIGAAIGRYFDRHDPKTVASIKKRYFPALA